jgi:hypothetical protein
MYGMIDLPFQGGYLMWCSLEPEAMPQAEFIWAFSPVK